MLPVDCVSPGAPGSRRRMNSRSPKALGDKVVSLDESAEVTSALPLSSQEQETVKKSFSAKEVSFKVDPGILGGLVVKIGDKVLDGSVAGKLEGLRQTLK